MSVHFSYSVTQLCPTFRRQGLQHARLSCPSLSPEFAQTHVHRVVDAIQPFHLLCPLCHLAIKMNVCKCIFDVVQRASWTS